MSAFERAPPGGEATPRERVLSKPSTPHANNGRDNENDDLILRVNDELGARVSSGAPKGRHGRENFPSAEDEDERATYRIVDSLGSGTFGQVVACESSTDGKTRALKVIKNHPAYFHQAHVEIGILRTLNTRCKDKPASAVIVELLDYFICHNHLTLVFELLGMNLYELLRKNKFKGLHLGVIRGMMRQLLGALDLLRDAHIVHCDIKPENILLCSNNSFQVKLVDFGSACFQNRTVYQYIQSRFYRSPEVFLGMPYGMPIDMWSLGCVGAELFLGLPIFPGSSEYDLLSRICETIGMPPNDMLAKAPNAKKFFTRVDIGFDESSSSPNSVGTSTYKLYSLREYESRSGKRALMGKKYFKYTDFSDIIASVPYQSSCVDPNDEAAMEEETKARMRERSAFYDLLIGMMEIDPNVRWTPAQALKHPFITGERFDAPYTPEHIPERSTPQERENLQRVAAKEAALVSSGSPVKKKRVKPQLPIAEEPPTPTTPVPVGPPSIPLGGLAAALAASSSVMSSPAQPVTPKVLNPAIADAFTGAMLQAQAAAHAAATVAALSPGGVPMSPGGGLGGGYPPFVVGSVGALSSSYNSSSLLASSFIGSPHALNSAALHPLHFGVSPPTSAMSNMGLSTSQQSRAAQAATAVQLPPASPLSRGSASFLTRGMNGGGPPAQRGTSMFGSSYAGQGAHTFGRSTSRESLKTVKEVAAADSPPPHSPSPMDEDHAEGADWDPTFSEMLDEEKVEEKVRTSASTSGTASEHIAIPSLSRATLLPPQPYPIVGFPASSSVPAFSAPLASSFSQSPSSAFEASPKSSKADGTNKNARSNTST